LHPRAATKSAAPVTAHPSEGAANLDLTLKDMNG
jgi:hypothetical protein